MTQPTTEAERIRSYLVAQAAKLSLPELVEKVRRDCQPLAAAAALVPPHRFRQAPAPGQWSAADVWAHIIEMNEVGAAAIEAILQGHQPPVRVVDDSIRQAARALPGGPECHARYHARREQLLARVAAARGDEHLHTTIRHPMFGDLNWREWLLFMRVHDLDHLRQLQAIAAALGEGAGQGVEA
ncbi:DinB family protein [Tepidiforma sp.]|uniref:DinB family protein n=1 Tax=Tepidiforma sp. TaxID=2682230 RepID=UPI002ADE1966|nr:DinB family protein [Tepidiforma sp.]